MNENETKTVTVIDNLSVFETLFTFHCIVEFFINKYNLGVCLKHEICQWIVSRFLCTLGLLYCWLLKYVFMFWCI